MEDKTLRLTQTSLGEDRYRVEIALERKDKPRRIATCEFSFKLTPQDQEDIRWYLEDYLQYPLDPAPKIAARIEKRMAEIGSDLFKKIFHHNDDTRKLWFTVSDKLNETRVEILTGVEEATTIPWELMHDPTADKHLALDAHSFVRASHQPTQSPKLPDVDSGLIRILLAICRPERSEDVPFRSVASRLIRGLDETDREDFQLDVLRPPTFEALAQKLRTAKDVGKPYHVVHFDGHGAFLDVEELFANWKDKSEKEIEEMLSRLIHIDSKRFSPETIYPNPRREGQRGYLVFDNPKSEYNLRLVDGPELGKLLSDTDTSVLVLNACRSAHSEAPQKPETASEEAPRDIHAQIRAQGSLAQEIMDAGVAGVVAMRYSVYVFTAAQFVADLYAALAKGQTLGKAVTLGRQQLKEKPLREIAYDPMPLQDWCVPLVHEAAPIALFPKPAKEERVHIELKPEGRSTAVRGELDPKLPPPPDVGFFGRDETLLALDRAFDDQPIVLLHAYAGSGKTATAAEFARWYWLTGGVKGAVLFTSFEQHRPLARVIDQFGQTFGQALEQSGIHWLALEDEQRRKLAIQLLQRVPVLWIWDNVEPVTGFPTGTESAWSTDEQKELADFLRAARDTKAKFLLTSRRDEQKWLHDLPARVTLPPMPMQERVQLARAIAEKHSYRLADISDWRPLLRYTQGNPLTITVVVGQALRAGLKTGEEIETFVEKLRSGEAGFEDDESEGRSRSLGASLRYGFENAFNEDERKILALLHLFQGSLDVDALKLMGNPKMEWHLPELGGLTPEAGITLLDRAAEVGLLTALGGGYYSIHPALPWFFKALFNDYFPISSTTESESPAQMATRAFVEALSALGDYYHGQYIEGNRDVINLLTAEEANLLHARRLARANEWWGTILGTMQGLCILYDHTGRRVEWKRLMEEIVPYFVDPETDGPLQGKEEQWGIVTQHRVLLARKERQWSEAEGLQRLLVEWDRKLAAPALEISADSLNGTQRNAIRSLATSLHDLAQTHRLIGQPECEKSYKEALKWSEHIGDKAAAAICAYNLGLAYKNVPDLRNLEETDRWTRQSLKLREERDYLGRAKCIIVLGTVALERFNDARTGNRSKDELLKHLNEALRHYHESLDLLPSNAVDDLAVVHNQLGQTYRFAGQTERALLHYIKSIQYNESQGNLFRAANTRFNVALNLAGAGRFEDALLYAHAALRNYQTYGERAAKEVQETKDLITEIEKDLKKQ